MVATAKAGITTAASSAVLREVNVARSVESPQSFAGQSEPQNNITANTAVSEADQTQYRNQAEDPTHSDDQDLDLQPLEGSVLSAQDEEPEAIEGEPIRDGSGLAEPAFSYIAGHVEPLLLRILESIHITEESVSLVESIRRSVIKGLNWYDFVAILEQILQVLRNAADGQRAEFQGFLSEVTESLAQVQAFVEHSKRDSDKNAAAEAAMDATVRAQIQDIKTAVESSDTDIESLKSVVQNQIGSIISSLDGFKAQRTA